jgi:hypothetical protein
LISAAEYIDNIAIRWLADYALDGTGEHPGVKTEHRHFFTGL